MTRIKLAYIHEFKDRHGKVRYYFRRPGFKRVALKGAPGSTEFMDAYQAALAGDTAPRVEIGAARTMPGTVDAAIVGYLDSPTFNKLKPSTKATYRGILARFRDEHGDKRIGPLERRHIERIIADKAATPWAANNLLKVLRGLLKHAVLSGMRRDDPSIGVQPIKAQTAGFLVWGEDEIAAFRSTHPLGTKPRLALELLLNTGQRRGDVVKMGPRLVRSGLLSMRQEKTGTMVEIPILPDLANAIEAMPGGKAFTFLTTDAGLPFTSAGFGNWFRQCCNAAGLPAGYAAHGLRKWAATHHANQGATAHELMAWFGWKTLKEAERYTRSANRKALAQGMVAKLQKGTTSGKPQ